MASETIQPVRRGQASAAVPQGITTWRNPTSKPVTFTIFGDSPGVRTNYRIEPGEIEQLDSKYDQAIRFVNHLGVVMGGLAPQLVKLGEEPGTVKLHSSLDPLAVQLPGTPPSVAMELERLKAENARLQRESEAKASENSALAERMAAIEARLAAPALAGPALAVPAGKAHRSPAAAGAAPMPAEPAAG